MNVHECQCDALTVLLEAPLPEDLLGRPNFRTCLFCRRRASFVGDGVIKVDTGVDSEPSILLKNFRLLQCCSASYSTKHKTVVASKLQVRQARDRQKEEERRLLSYKRKEEKVK